MESGVEQPPSVDLKQQTLHLVANDRPGLPVDELVKRLTAHPALQERPQRLVLHKPGAGSSLAGIAREAAARARADGGVVLACGGDGTINAAAQAAWPLGVPLAVLPQGTFNYFSRNLDLGDDAVDGLRRLIEPARQACCRAWRVGLVNDRLFLVNASIGLYPRLLAEREQAKQRFGRHRWVAWVSGLKSLLEPVRGLNLTLQDRRTDGSLGASREVDLATLFIGANDLQLSDLGLTLQAATTDGQRPLTGVLLQPQPRGTMARLAWRAMRGSLPEDPVIESFEFGELEVHGGSRWRARRLRVAIDGETTWLPLPLRVTHGLRPLWLVCPPSAQPADAPAPAFAPALQAG